MSDRWNPQETDPGMCVTVKTFDELFAELTEKAAARPAGSGTVAALDALAEELSLIHI